MGHQLGLSKHLVRPTRWFIIIFPSIRIDTVGVVENILISLRHSHDLADLVGQLFLSTYIAATPDDLDVSCKNSYLYVGGGLDINQHHRHGLSTLDDRLRQAVAVVEHNLFHITLPIS